MRPDDRHLGRHWGRHWGRRWGHAKREDAERGTPPRPLVVALLLACASLMVLDQNGGAVLDPARRAVGEVVGPAQAGTAGAIRPIVALPGWFESRDEMRAELASLEAENAGLRSQVRSSGFDRNRLAELEGLTSAASDLEKTLLPARVIGIGPSQSFSSTVTIDAGSDAGLRPDLTVLNNDGLVGRVLRVTETTATVLLIVDTDSTVGGRIGETLDLGFLHGRGVLGDQGRLDLELVDQTVVPAKGDAVVTWGTGPGGTSPYVAGVPVGTVTSVYSSVRETSQRAVIDPYVDFAALDVVGVVVPSGTRSDRAVVEADGSLR